ncbi:DUF1707 domain-containing protein [Actinomycetospora sp. TBRC 11914]|uniref:DUF1707 SHOCT-like domain-containing protein n=1 Tax=Actinomycetospora sp. TBRC 11914 TaxID=2729387 RepID=UPI00145EFFAD|nr:DUF1707 domain-containing protein [Actinomycetospora sp. TBRC 11914]NMO88530.1 DUF1707 domain-containing protein [Actinomycetospora sp. TBRC 11914]
MSGPDRGTRASDAEREAVVVRLHAAVGEGRLTADEAGDRMAAVYAARYREELAAPVADLPGTGAAASGPPSWEALWALLLWRARVVLDGPQAAQPGARQERVVAVLAGLAVLWTVLWVLLGAVVA